MQAIMQIPENNYSWDIGIAKWLENTLRSGMNSVILGGCLALNAPPYQNIFLCHWKHNKTLTCMYNKNNMHSWSVYTIAVEQAHRDKHKMGLSTWLYIALHWGSVRKVSNNEHDGGDSRPL